MKPHPGKNRRIAKGGKFWMTVGHERPAPTVMDAEEDSEF
jgi:hypothetical protein